MGKHRNVVDVVEKNMDSSGCSKMFIDLLCSCDRFLDVSVAFRRIQEGTV